MSDLLSKDEIEALEAEVKAELLEKKKEAASEAMREKIRRDLAYKEGLVTGNAVKDEIVNILIDLAPFAPAITLNGMHYFHGSSYTVPRHIADTLAEQAYRTWKHQNEIDGKSITDFQGQKRVAEMYDVKKSKTVGTELNGRSGATKRLG